VLCTASRGDLAIRELPFVTQINLRADPTDAGLMQLLAARLGFALPVTPNTVASSGDRRALWLGPDEWLIVGPEGRRGAMDGALRDALGETFGSIVDVSANRTVLEVRGVRARDLLAHGVAIDLDARSFGPGRCVQTLLAKAQVIIECTGDPPAFYVFVRSSFANYAAEWLLDASSEPTR
jgi:sarcosine oxidase subunit gamma